MKYANSQVEDQVKDCTPTNSLNSVLPVTIIEVPIRATHNIVSHPMMPITSIPVTVIPLSKAQNASINNQTIFELPPKAKLPAREYSELYYFFQQYLNEGRFEVVSPAPLDVQDKKYNILKAFGFEHSGVDEVMKLSDRFWSNFNFQQIVYITSVITLLSIIRLDGSKVTFSQKQNGYWGLDHSNSKSLYWDCIKSNIAIAGLNTNTQLGISVLDNINYGLNIAKQHYPNICNGLNHLTPEIIVNFSIYGFEPIEDHIYNISQIENKLRVGDIVYTIPLDWGFESYEQLYIFYSSGMICNFFNEFLKELDFLKFNNLNDLSKPLLIATINDYFNKNKSNLQGAISEFLYNQMREKSINAILSLIYKSKTLENLEYNIDALIQTHNTHKQNLSETKKTISHNQANHNQTSHNSDESSNQKLFDPSRSNMHVFTVVDKVSDSIKVLQIDGGVPHLPCSIQNLKDVTRPQDKAIIIRNDN